MELTDPAKSPRFDLSLCANGDRDGHIDSRYVCGSEAADVAHRQYFQAIAIRPPDPPSSARP
jgi:hypothetical protein